MVVTSEAVHRLTRVYGDHVHNNYGRHIDGVIVDDELWQIWWRLLVIQSRSRYCTPQGGVDRKFFGYLADNIGGVQEKRYSVEHHMCFVWVTLQITPGANKSHEIRRRIICGA